MYLFLEFKRLILMSSHGEFGSYVLSFLEIVMISSSKRKIVYSKSEKRKKKRQHDIKEIMFIHIEYLLQDTSIS